MKLRVATLAAVGLVLAGIANAEEIKVDNGAGEIFTPSGGCDVTGYKSYAGDGGFIPDCSDGAVFGPVLTPADGSTFDGVVLEVSISHTWLGDLRVNLAYDVDCDGAPEVGPISALCRAALDGCPTAADVDCCGCSDDLAGTYLYGDDGGVSMEAACGAGFQAPGCYALDPDSALPMAALDGIAKGGCFTLLVEDGACLDTGFVDGWAVYSRNGGGGTPVNEASWTELKGTF
jgi:hypothetical protein